MIQWITLPGKKDFEVRDCEASRALRTICDAHEHDRHMRQEAIKLCLCVVDCYGDKIIVTTPVWRDRFGRKFDAYLKHHNVHIVADDKGRRALFDLKYSDNAEGNF